MKTLHENISMPDYKFPIKAFIRSYKSENNIFVHPHWHDVIEILYIIEGKATQQINNRVFEVNKGELILIAGGQIHSTYTQKEDKNEILVLQFSPDLFCSEHHLFPKTIPPLCKRTPVISILISSCLFLSTYTHPLKCLQTLKFNLPIPRISASI
jgi:AraC family transcriptional activator of pobA